MTPYHSKAWLVSMVAKLAAGSDAREAMANIHPHMRVGAAGSPPANASAAMQQSAPATPIPAEAPLARQH